MLNYSTYVAALVTLGPYPASTDATLSADLPNIIDDAEQRIYRELDLLNTNVVSTGLLTISTRAFTLPSTNGTYLVLDTINVITPATATTADLGTRNALVAADRAMLDFTYPSSSGSTVPMYFAMVTQGQIVVAPWPDQAYTVEVTGTIRPPSLSSTVTTTLLTVFFPDLFLAASMVRLAALQKNFGAATDDPKMATTWEAHYQTLLQSAQVEEARKKFTSQGWSSKQPAPIATPPRA